MVYGLLWFRYQLPKINTQPHRAVILSDHDYGGCKWGLTDDTGIQQFLKMLPDCIHILWMDGSRPMLKRGVITNLDVMLHIVGVATVQIHAEQILQAWNLAAL